MLVDLQTVCHACGRVFVVVQFMTPERWRADSWVSRDEWCPHCATYSRYLHSEYFLS